MEKLKKSKTRAFENLQAKIKQISKKYMFLERGLQVNVEIQYYNYYDTTTDNNGVSHSHTSSMGYPVIVFVWSTGGMGYGMSTGMGTGTGIGIGTGMGMCMGMSMNNQSTMNMAPAARFDSASVPAHTPVYGYEASFKAPPPAY